jgi:sugar/nucleoside kinase (ribokinase family)
MFLNRLGELNITVEVLAGTHINDACRQAIALAKKLGIEIEFDFNGTIVRAKKGDTLKEVVDSFDKVRDVNTILGAK